MAILPLGQRYCSLGCVQCQDNPNSLGPMSSTKTRSPATKRSRTRRIDVRVSDEQDAIIREGAALAGQTITAFLLDAAQERAHGLLDERRHLVMSEGAFERFAQALEEPPEQIPALSELFRLPRIASR